MIYSPETSYVTESGTPVHIILDALSVVARLNPMQFDELAVNDASRSVVKEIKKAKTLGDKFKILFDFIKILNPDDYKSLKAYIHDLTEDQKEVFMHKVIKHGIYVQLDPVENLNILDIENMYDAYPIQRERIVFADGTKSLNTVIVAPLYYYRLKQDPVDKFSVRGRGSINPIYHLPSKSADKSFGNEMYSNVAVKMGIYELELLMMCKSPEAVAAFMAVHCTSSSAREMMAMLYHEPLTKHNVKEFMSKVGDRKKNREVIEAYLSVLGIDIEIEYEDNPDFYKFRLERKGSYVKSKII